MEKSFMEDIHASVQWPVGKRDSFPVPKVDTLQMFPEGHRHQGAQSIVDVLDPRLLHEAVAWSHIGFIPQVVADLRRVEREKEPAPIAADMERCVIESVAYTRTSLSIGLTIANDIWPEAKESAGGRKGPRQGWNRNICATVEIRKARRVFR